MAKTLDFHRRHFLRGLGAAVALPAFESLAPKIARASPALATTANQVPLRMAFLYVPNGVHVEQWTPRGAGENYELNTTMQALAEQRSEFQIISQLEHQNGRAGKDGGGDHARANATILTGARPKKTAGADIHLGVSIDQFAARHLQDQTRFASLELSCDGARKSGSCDSGYSCAYQYNLSWSSATTPVAAENNPRLVFERLFGKGSGTDRQRNFEMRKMLDQSVLDFVLDDATRLQKLLGHNDQLKLDEYLTGVRELEHRIEKAERFGPLPKADREAPEGIPEDYQEHIRTMFDLLLRAFQTDSTRVATFLLAHDGSNRSFQSVGVSEGHHSLSHHQNDSEKLQKIATIDRFYIDQLAYFLKRMRSCKDVDGNTLLHNSMLVYASGLSDGNHHRHDNLPVIVAGHGGGALRPGRHVDLGRKTPMTNLYMRMLTLMGIDAERFGDSTGSVGRITS